VSDSCQIRCPDAHGPGETEICRLDRSRALGRRVQAHSTSNGCSKMKRKPGEGAVPLRAPASRFITSECLPKRLTLSPLENRTTICTGLVFRVRDFYLPGEERRVSLSAGPVDAKGLVHHAPPKSNLVGAGSLSSSWPLGQSCAHQGRAGRGADLRGEGLETTLGWSGAPSSHIEVS